MLRYNKSRRSIIFDVRPLIKKTLEFSDLSSYQTITTVQQHVHRFRICYFPSKRLFRLAGKKQNETIRVTTTLRVRDRSRLLYTRHRHFRSTTTNSIRKLRPSRIADNVPQRRLCVVRTISVAIKKRFPFVSVGADRTQFRQCGCARDSTRRNRYPR